MSTRVVDRIDGWDERPFSGGYRGLTDLAEGGFSGVVRAGVATLYMTNGAVVGVEDGTIEAFEGADGSAYRAPSAALPLLAVMQERSDEVRAKYYTEETPVSEVDRTLSDGGFTGYVELSENVLSGDYYLVYHGGESMSVAFVGNSSRLIDGEEAFGTADDEVGIYEVRPVEIEAIEIPEPEPEPTGGAATEPESEPDPPEPGPGAGSEQDPRTGSAPDPGVQVESDAGSAPGRVTEPGTAGRADRRDAAGTSGVEAADPPGGESDDRPRESEASPTPGGEATASTTAQESPAGTDRQAGESSPKPPGNGSTAGNSGASVGEPDGPGAGGADAATGRPEVESSGTGGSGDGASVAATEPSGETEGEVALETRSIPSLDPERTVSKTDEEAGGAAAGPNRTGTGGTDPESERTAPASAAEQERNAAGTAGESATEQEPPPGTEAGAGEEVRERLRTREAEIDRLEEELGAATDRHEELEAELADLRAERDELREEVERLEGELDRLREEFGAAGGAERRLTPAEALDGTDLFVRYRSKGEATLEKAHDGEERKEQVTENLRLEKHTQFEAESAAVGGQSFDPFLEERIEYGFVRWAVEDLLFEIRDTGHAEALADLYDALPKVDRAELDGTIAVRYTEDGQEQRGQESFDIVLRDRMGNPLLVANLNDSREAATEGMMERLITAAERVGQSKDTFVGAFLVTESFFEPEALETANEATKSGLLSRDKRQSFVNLSRKRGYHLCLVEARNKNFHLAVPEL